MYVAVMLFEGWGVHLSTAPFHVEGHPFHAANNVNGVAIDSILDYQVLPLAPGVQQAPRGVHPPRARHAPRSAERAVGGRERVVGRRGGRSRVRKFLGLDHVPEWGDSTEWQYWVIDTVKRYEGERGYPSHPIGMTMQFPVPDQTKVNEPLFASRAEWISPGFEEPELFPGQPRAPGLVRRPARRGREEGRDR